MVGVWVVRHVAGTWQHLQLCRAPGGYAAGLWTCCRGKIEAGETAVDAAFRELREETALTPDRLYRMGTLEQFYAELSDTVWSVPFFVAHVPADAAVALNPEHTAFRWVADGDIDGLLAWPSEVPLLAELRRFHFVPHPARELLRVRER